ncbi:MAG: biotin--[acetyl-CoA-carboxylase] ligase [Candidatus Omnitrophica bacterium]|nr:biotin--[acetyl-CoA-carboxylase] ligase [Candidatus Omnitrophota bacterium]
MTSEVGLDAPVSRNIKENGTMSTPTIGNTVRHLKEVGSTQDAARSWAAEGAAVGAVVVADSQTAGRGRHGRPWISPAGKGLYLSVVLGQDGAERGIQWSIAAAVAVSRALEGMTGLRAGIRWPNDVLVTGKKVCGILAETYSEGPLILGLGINLSGSGSDLDPQASTLAELRGSELEPEALLERLLEELGLCHTVLSEGRFEVLLMEARERSVLLGRQVRVQCSGREFTAQAVDLEANGALRVRTEDGKEESLTAAEVERLR